MNTHPFRGGAPFPLLTETPPTFGRPLRIFHMLLRKFSIILSPSCFAVCGHKLSSRITIVFSRYYLVYQTSPCHIRQCSPSPLLAHPASPGIFHILVDKIVVAFSTESNGISERNKLNHWIQGRVSNTKQLCASRSKTRTKHVIYRACHRPVVRAGPGQADLKNVMGRAGPDRAGPGRGF